MSIKRGFYSCLLVVAAFTAPAAYANNETVLAAAKASQGKKMWFGYGLPNGTLGCAAALCNVLKQAGYKQPHSAAVRFVYKQLRTVPGAKEFSLKGDGATIDGTALATQTKPGDVLLAFHEFPDKPNLGPNAHCGIVGQYGQIYTNDWNDGIWKLGDFQRYFYHYKHFRIFRLP